jgi:Holliday junction resolvase-like predicted endonuclease
MGWEVILNVSWLFGTPKKRSSYGIRAEKNAEDYLKKRFKTVSMNRTLKRAPASHGPADWEVLESTGKIVALIQVKSSKYKGGARISPRERDKLIKTAKEYHTRAFVTKCERSHYTTNQVYPIRR